MNKWFVFAEVIVKK